MAEDGKAMGWKQPEIAFSSYILLQKHPVITFLSVKVDRGQGIAHKQAQIGVNGQKLTFQANGGRGQDNGEETAWNSFPFVYIIATASSDNILVKKSRGGVRGSPISRGKCPKIQFDNFIVPLSHVKQ